MDEVEPAHSLVATVGVQQCRTFRVGRDKEEPLFVGPVLEVRIVLSDLGLVGTIVFDARRAFKPLEFEGSSYLTIGRRVA